VFQGPAEAIPDVAAPDEDHEAKNLLSHVYTILDRLPADERIAFVLRVIDQQPLTEVAKMCGCSLATIKRRIARAQKLFARHAAEVPDLAERMGKSPRWRKHDVV
jgi:RNA polymerase sigma-70 factor (ECF subfamily)